jgi:hypothetical protein
LGATAPVLGWTVDGGDYDEALNETLLAYGQTDITLISGDDNLRKLRALGRVEVWRAVMADVSLDYDFKADGGDYRRSQMYEQARDQFHRALDEAMQYLPEYAIDVGTFEDAYDPYARLSVSEYEARAQESIADST